LNRNQNHLKNNKFCTFKNANFQAENNHIFHVRKNSFGTKNQSKNTIPKEINLAHFSTLGCI